MQSNTEAMETLIEFGAGIHLQDNMGKFPLYFACELKTTRPLSILLAHMTSRRFDFPDPQVTSNHTDCFLKFCLEQRDRQGFTALEDCAYYKGREDLAQLLLDAGADVNSVSSPKGVPGSPFLFSVQGNRHAIAKLLLERGARLDLHDAEMQGTLHVAAICGDLAMIQMIGKEEALRDLYAEHKDAFGNTPLEAFDKVRSQYKVEDEATRQECRQAFLELLSRTQHGAEVVAADADDGQDAEGGEEMFYDCEANAEDEQRN